jgi:hypothetical protein
MYTASHTRYEQSTEGDRLFVQQQVKYFAVYVCFLIYIYDGKLTYGPPSLYTCLVRAEPTTIRIRCAALA